MLTTSELDAAQGFLKKAIAAALKSPDLTETDRRRVIDILKQRYNDAKNMLGAGAFAEGADSSLGALMSEAMPPSQAAALGPINESEALAGLH
jgi:hypothetical protein